ncbi:MAG: arginine repressor [Oscillospiraceae bacterium]
MKSKRHSKILELIAQNEIDTQDELLNRLCECGFSVTQATVSRDIKELRLIKTLAHDGKYKYTTSASKSDNNSSFRFNAIFSESVNEVDYAQNLVVVKCYTGMANAACAAIDLMHWQGSVGTIAGDDTILMVMRNEDFAVKVVGQLNKMLLK